MLTEEQLKDRKNYIGGSDMAVILGLSKYKTPYQLWLEKTGVESSEQQENQYIYWGNKLESVVRDEFAERNNISIETPDTLIHPEYNFLRGNLDGFIPEWNAVLEVKTASGFMANEWGESGSDVIPMQYLCQVAHYCAVANADCAHIAVLIGGNDYREFKYIRNMDIEKSIIEKAKEFWNCVVTDTPPPASNQIDLKLMFPTHAPEKVKELDSFTAEQLEALLSIKAKTRELTEAEEQYKLELMKIMEDAEALVDGTGRPVVTWKTNKRGSRTFLIKQ